MRQFNVNEWIAIVLVGECLAVYVWDLFALSTAGAHPTVSQVIIETSRNRPIIPLLIGLVIGHLLWPQ